MKIFFDTEFTQFRDGELLSIGFVAEDDRSLVVEVHDADRHRRASDFCHQYVLPQFGAAAARAVRDDAGAGVVIADWLEQFSPPLELCYDYKLDWRFLEVALRAAGRWEGLDAGLRPVHVGDETDSEQCLQAQADFFKGRTWPGRHHPLVDAMALRQRWRAHLYMKILRSPAPSSDPPDGASASRKSLPREVEPTWVRCGRPGAARAAPRWSPRTASAPANSGRDARTVNEARHRTVKQTMRVFVSHYPSETTRRLVRSLRQSGFEVDESPTPTTSSDPPSMDPRWPAWYSSGLGAAVRWCDAFVVGVNREWGGTWMASEWSEAVLRTRWDPHFRLYLWDPEGLFAGGPPAAMTFEFDRTVPLPPSVEEVLSMLGRDRGAAATENQPNG